MPPRLLIVEESQELARLLAAAAGCLGTECTLCASGREALDRLAGIDPAAALLDLPLSDLRGSEVLSALRQAGVPAVAVSGVFMGPRCAEELSRLGAAAFFEKPFRLEVLLGALAPLLGVEAAAEGGEVEDEVTDSEMVEEGAASVPSPRRPDGPRPPRGSSQAQGDLAMTRVPRLVAAFHTAQATGALTLQRGKVKRLVLFRRGAPVFASSNLAADRFGALCVRRGIVTQARREALMREAGTRARTAEALVRQGLLSPERRVKLTAEQVRAIIWSTFTWRDGDYRLQVKPLPRRDLVPLSLFAGDLVLEGVLRTATLAEMRQEVPPSLSLAPAPDPAFELHALGLRPAEAHLLSLADGTRSVADLVALSDLPEREALAFLHACRLMDLLDEAERVLAGTRRMAFM